MLHRDGACLLQGYADEAVLAFLPLQLTLLKRVSVVSEGIQPNKPNSAPSATLVCGGVRVKIRWQIHFVQMDVQCKGFSLLSQT